MDNFYENIDEYNLSIKRKILIIFDDMIAEYMLSNKKINPIETELFIRYKKLNISLFLLRNLILP